MSNSDKKDRSDLRPLCWFILALGVTPSMAMKNTFLGWIMRISIDDLLLSDSEVRVVIVGVGAIVDDSVHVKVQVVKLGNLVLFHNLAQTGIPADAVLKKSLKTFSLFTFLISIGKILAPPFWGLCCD